MVVSLMALSMPAMALLNWAAMVADRTSSKAWSRALAPTWATLGLEAVNGTPIMLAP